MIPRARLLLFFVGAIAVGLLAVPAFGALPALGHAGDLVGDVLVPLSVEARRTANTVTATMFDMRAIDTVGEEAILFAAVAGTSLLLRILREEREEEPEIEARAPQVAQRSPAVRLVGVGLVGLLALVGLTMFAQGHLSPGGGFQGGVVVAGAVLLVYLLHDYAAFDALADTDRLEPVEGLAIAAMLAVGTAGLLTGEGFLANVLPLGDLGTLPSGGTIPVLNVLSGVAVAAGISIILAEFAEQTLRVRGD